jgi:hypothetical protein
MFVLTGVLRVLYCQPAADELVPIRHRGGDWAARIQQSTHPTQSYRFDGALSLFEISLTRPSPAPLFCGAFLARRQESMLHQQASAISATGRPY